MSLRIIKNSMRPHSTSVKLVRQPRRINVPPAFNRYVALVQLQCLPIGMRLNLDADTYVVRNAGSYIAYRTWMSIFPLIEVFEQGEETGLVNWLEQFGYSFENQASVSMARVAA